MIDFHVKEAINLLIEVFGRGLFVLFAVTWLIGAFNFVFVNIKGIQYLDREFSPEKKYNDTWTYAASSRFFDYCWSYLWGKIKIQKFGIRVWMCFNSFVYVVMCFSFVYCVLFELWYRFIISW
jgi:hypothetical protein